MRRESERERASVRASDVNATIKRHKKCGRFIELNSLRQHVTNNKLVLLQMNCEQNATTQPTHNRNRSIYCQNFFSPKLNEVCSVVLCLRESSFCIHFAAMLNTLRMEIEEQKVSLAARVSETVRCPFANEVIDFIPNIDLFSYSKT